MIFDFDLKHSFVNKAFVFNLDVQYRSAAKRLAIVGHSGAGKSLMLQLIAGLHRLEKGYVRVDGHTYVDTKNHDYCPIQKRGVGFVFQEHVLFPHLTVAQNIAFSSQKGWFNPSKKINAQTQKWLAYMQIEHIAHHYPSQISGGQAQRVALARACYAQPRCLLLDEPFSALDTELKIEVRELIYSLQKTLDIPMILISHDDKDIEYLADDCIRIQNGKRIDL